MALVLILDRQVSTAISTLVGLCCYGRCSYCRKRIYYENPKYILILVLWPEKEYLSSSSLRLLNIAQRVLRNIFILFRIQCMSFRKKVTVFQTGNHRIVLTPKATCAHWNPRTTRCVCKPSTRWCFLVTTMPFPHTQLCQGLNLHGCQGV